MPFAVSGVGMQRSGERWPYVRVERVWRVAGRVIGTADDIFWASDPRVQATGVCAGGQMLAFIGPPAARDAPRVEYLTRCEAAKIRLAALDAARDVPRRGAALEASLRQRAALRR